jgi:hypothetical protein
VATSRLVEELQELYDEYYAEDETRPEASDEAAREFIERWPDIREALQGVNDRGHHTPSRG